MIEVLNEDNWRWKTTEECLCGAILQVDSDSIWGNLENDKMHYYYYCPKCRRKNYIDSEKINTMPQDQRLHLKSKNDSWFSSGFGRL